MISAASSRVSGLFGTGPETVAVELDDALTVLKNERRRHLVRHVATMDADETVDARELAHYVGAREWGKSPAEIHRPSTKSVYVALVSTHLEKLAAVGVVRYDSDRKVISPGPAVDVFAEYLAESEQRFQTAEEGSA